MRLLILSRSLLIVEIEDGTADDDVVVGIVVVPVVVEATSE